MNLDELEHRTREQIRALQEEYQTRLEPLIKILCAIHMIRRPQIFISREELRGFSPISSPEYKSAQEETNKAYHALLDHIPNPPPR